MKQTTTEALNITSKIIDWYRGLDSVLNADRRFVDDLTRARRKLASAKATIGAYSAELKAEKERAYFHRKARHAEIVASLRENMSATDANIQALLKIKTEKHEEIEAERNFETVRNLHHDIGEILNAMASDINSLRDEYRRANIAEEK